MNRRLYRSRTDTVIGGVAAGLAHYLNADPALVRIAWAILVPLTGGAALLAYIVAWIVVPEEPATAAPFVAPVEGATAGVGDTAAVGGETPAAGWAPPEPVRRTGSPGNAGLVVGAGLVFLGLWFLLREYLPEFNWGLVWPILIVGIGLLILVNATRRND
jgi:phage shock protein PspC (stress-responsive transcriptional regulator)